MEGIEGRVTRQVSRRSILFLVSAMALRHIVSLCTPIALLLNKQVADVSPAGAI